MRQGGARPLFRRADRSGRAPQIATAFIAWHNATGRVAGFYTLSAAHVPFTALGEDWRKRLPLYPSLPAVLIGRLAIDRRFKGQGLGSALLADAAARSMGSDIAARFLVVDAIDEDAALFYQHHGFRRSPALEHASSSPSQCLKRCLKIALDPVPPGFPAGTLTAFCGPCPTWDDAPEPVRNVCQELPWRMDPQLQQTGTLDASKPIPWADGPASSLRRFLAGHAVAARSVGDSRRPFSFFLVAGTLHLECTSRLPPPTGLPAISAI